MKAILEFELPDDGIEFAQAVHAHNLSCTLWDFDQELRSAVKYGVWLDGQKAREEDRSAAEKVRERLREIMNDHGLNFEMSMFQQG
jgi:hypothetical protein